MENTPTPRNRKERRAQAKQKRDEVPLSQPSRDAPKQKTLLEIATERQLLPPPSTSTTSIPASIITQKKINPDGSLSAVGAQEEEEESSATPVDSTATTPYLDIALYTFSLSLLHFTFTVLVHNQYGSSPPSLPSLLYSSTITSPAPLLLLALVALLHPHSGHPVVQILFAAMSVGCGMWLVHTTNREAYLATMKKAPPLGTLWVWAVVELRWEIAVGCLAVVAGWGWWWGYGIT